MKKVAAILLAVSIALFGAGAAQSDPVFGTSANVVVNVSVNSIFGFSVDTDFLTMNFTVDEDDPNPPAQTLEILASSNKSVDWELRVTVDRFTNGIDSPLLFSTIPQDGAANGYQNAAGTVPPDGVFAPQLNYVFYDSVAQENGQGILVALSFRPLGMAGAPAGNYSTTATVTMVEG